MTTLIACGLPSLLCEGVGGLSETELRTDLRNRGLPTKDLNHKQMQKAMQQWLSLSQEKEIPYAILIWTSNLIWTSLIALDCLDCALAGKGDSERDPKMDLEPNMDLPLACSCSPRRPNLFPTGTPSSS